MADERNYYVICENNCKFPAMTKEQTLAAIKQAVETGEIQNVDAGFVTKLQEQNTRSGLSFWIGTQAEYNAIEEPIKDCFYIITDDTIGDDLFETIERLREDVSGTVAAVEQFQEEMQTMSEDLGEMSDKLEQMPVYNDFVVEQGQIGFWNYRKWDSGVAECWGVRRDVVDVNIESTEKISRSEQIIAPLPEGLFTCIDHVDITAGRSMEYYPSWVQLVAASLVDVRYTYYSFGAYTRAETDQTSLFVNGRWK